MSCSKKEDGTKKEEEDGTKKGEEEVKKEEEEKEEEVKKEESKNSAKKEKSRSGSSSPTSSRPKLTTCVRGKTLDSVNNVCIPCSPVQNATFTTANSCAFTCESGYFKKNNKCEKKKTTCDIGHVLTPGIDDTKDNTCTRCPLVEGGTLLKANSCYFECNSGYVKRKDKCCPDVQNGTFTTANSCAFKCNTGYVKKNNKCEVKLTTCAAGKTLDTVNNICNSCSPVQNATFTTANSCAFKCNTGYVKKNNKCEVKLTTCAAGKPWTP